MIVLRLRSVRPFLVLALAGCLDPDPSPGETLDRETFITTYIELRQLALATDSGEISVEARDEALERRGVDENDLRAFVARYGDDLVFMRDLWNEVERRMDALRADSIVDGGMGGAIGTQAES